MAKHIQMPPIYPIPQNWTWVELRQLTKIISGYPFDSKLFSDLNTTGRPLIRIRDVVRGYTETYTTEDCPNQYIIHKNDILIGMDGDFNVGKWQNEDALLNQRVCLIQSVSDLLLNDYLFYFLPKPLKQINDVTPSVTVKHLSTKTVESIMIPLPPLEEQKRLIVLIESLFAKLDEAKEKAQAVVDGFETRKAAILHQAFSGELTAKWRKENKVSFEKWENLTLDDVADYKKGPFGSSITKAMFVPKGENTFKVYEQGNAIRKTLDYGSYYISQKKYEELKGFAVKPGDIIVSCAGTIGEIYKLPNHCEAGVINQALMRVRVYSNINELYFIYYFTGVLKGDVIGEANGTAIKNIPPFKVLKAMNILLPSLPEQNKIVEILDCMLSKEQQVKETAEAVIEQIDTMKKAILARAFRGELGTNDPSKESAVELLKQIISTL